MDYTRENKKFYDEHFATHSFDYPSESVVRFLAECRGKFPNGGARMLDWGCATGRHTVAALRMGYEVVAADYVPRCIDITRGKVDAAEDLLNSPISYIVNQDTDIEQISDASLDIVLAFGIIFLNPRTGQLQILKSMSRMLKRGGVAFCDFRTPEDSLLIGAQPGPEGSYLVKDSRHDGLLYGIYPLEEVEGMISEAGLLVEKREDYSFTQDNRATKNCWWQFTLRKA